MSTFNPFPGLRPFQQSEKYLFFGREKQVVELITRLRKTRFMAVVGVSGSGKSSLVKAGVLPELHGGTMAAAGSSWEVAVMRPGGDPIGNLASCLINADLHDPEEEDIHSHVRATLSRSGMGLLDTIEQSDLEEDSNLLLVVDQFEEIFRFRQQSRVSNEEAGHFITLLLEASQQMRRSIYVVLTMRSDFLGDCAQFRDLAEAVNEGEYLIPRLNRTQRKEAIVGPVKVGGSDISNRLLQRLLNDIGDDPDQLPILQHALMRTWEQWEAFGAEGPLDLEHYRATGGMSEALSRHADEVYEELQTDSAKWTASKIFKALTERADQDRGIRRPMRFGELCEITEKNSEEVASAIDPFRMAGRTFLMPGSETDLKADTIVDISHESLMRVWTRLKSWVDDEAQSAKIYRRLADTASLRKDGRAGLYRDPDLQIALSWRSESKPNKAWADHYFPGFEEAMGFLNESHSEAEKEAKEKEAARKRELEQAQALALAEQEKAEAERKRAEEKEKAANRMKLLSVGLAFAGVLAICFLVFALIAKDEVETKVLELADRSAATAYNLSRDGKSSEALAWLNDAWSLAKKSREKQASYEFSMSEILQEVPIVTEVTKLNKGVVKAGFDQDRSEFYVINRVGNSFHVKNYNVFSWDIINGSELPFPADSLRSIVQVGNLLLFHTGERNLGIYSLSKNRLLQRQITLSGYVRIEFAQMLEKSKYLVLPIINFRSENRIQGQLAFINTETGEKAGMSDTFNSAFESSSQILSSITIDQDKEIIYLGTSIPRAIDLNSASNGNLYAYDFKDKSVRPIKNLDVNNQVNFLHFEPRNNLLILSDEDRSAFPIYNDSQASVKLRSLDGSIKQAIELESRPLQIESILGGTRLLIRSFDNTVTLWDIDSSAPIWVEKPDANINSMNVSPTGGEVLFALNSGEIISRSTLGASRKFSSVLPTSAIFGDFERNSRRFTSIDTNGLVKQFQIQVPELNRIIPKNINSSPPAFSTKALSLSNYVLDEIENVGFSLNGLAVDYQGKAEDEFVDFSFSEGENPSHFQIWPWIYNAFATDRFSKRALFSVFNEREELVYSKVIDFEKSSLMPVECNPANVRKVRISNLTENFARLGFSEIAFFKENRDHSIDYVISERNTESFLKVNSGYKVNVDGSLAVVEDSELVTSWEAAFADRGDNLAIDEQASISNAAKSAYYNGDLRGFLAISDYLKASHADDEIHEMKKVAHAGGNQIPLTKEIDRMLLSSLSGKAERPLRYDIISNISKELLTTDGAIDLIRRYGIVPSFFGEDLIDIIPEIGIGEQKYASLDYPKDVSFSNGLTLECWIKHGNDGAVINKGGGYDDSGFSLMLNNGNYRFELQNTETKEKAMLDIPLLDGRDWNHIALTWDAQNKDMSLYLNGEKTSQTSLFNGPIGNNNDIPLLLGGMATRTARKARNSAYSELRIWSVCRDEDEIRNFYEKRIEDPHPDLAFRRSFSTIPNGTNEQILDYYSNVDWPISDSLPFGRTIALAVGNSGATVNQTVYSLTAMGGLEFRKGNYEEAIHLLEKAKYGGINTTDSRISPDLINGLQNDNTRNFLLGLSYVQVGRVDDADKLMELTLRRTSNLNARLDSDNESDSGELRDYMLRELREEYIRERSQKN